MPGSGFGAGRPFPGTGRRRSRPQKPPSGVGKCELGLGGPAWGLPGSGFLGSKGTFPGREAWFLQLGPLAPLSAVGKPAVLYPFPFPNPYRCCDGCPDNRFVSPPRHRRVIFLLGSACARLVRGKRSVPWAHAKSGGISRGAVGAFGAISGQFGRYVAATAFDRAAFVRVWPVLGRPCAAVAAGGFADRAV